MYSFNAQSNKEEPHILDISNSNISYKKAILMDFDGTITNRDSLATYILSLWIQEPKLLKGLYSFVFLLLGFLGLIPAKVAKERLLSLFLKGKSQAQIEKLSALYVDKFILLNGISHQITSKSEDIKTNLLSPLEQFAHFLLNKFMPKIRPYFAKMLLEQNDKHPELKDDYINNKSNVLAQDDCYVIISASLDCYLSAIAKALNCHLICTQLEYQDGVFTGKIKGENCTGHYKKERFTQTYGSLLLGSHRVICYGNSSDDYELLSLASNNKHAHFNDFKQKDKCNNLYNFARLLRFHQYLKNFFVFIPLFFASGLFDANAFFKTCLCFISFCAASSTIYILNDLKDIEQDKAHIVKRYRPIASGLFSKKQSLSIVSVLLALALISSFSINIQVFFIVLGYLALNFLYVYYLKRVALVDIFCVALGFNLRVFAGALTCDIYVSEWLVLMVFLLAMFLVMGKRWDDLSRKNSREIRASSYGYNREFALSTLTLLSSVNTLCYIMYTMDESVISRVGSDYLYVTSLWVVMSNLRYLQNIFVFNRAMSPTKLLLSDSALAFCTLGWFVSMIIIFYS